MTGNALDDYVVLGFANKSSPSRLTRVEMAVELYEGKFSIDLESGTWNWRGDEVQERPIGGSRTFNREDDEGVIGVYNKTSLEHLDAMVRHWGEFVSYRNL